MTAFSTKERGIILVYAKQKLYEALSSLIRPGPLQQRLTYAAIPLLILQTPSNDTPESIRNELDAVVTALTTKPLSDAAGYHPRELSDDEATEIAERILSMFVKTMGDL